MGILTILSTSSFCAIRYEVERLLEMVFNGPRRICATFTVRIVFGAIYSFIFCLLGEKFIKNYSTYLVMVMITISIFVAPVASGLSETQLAVDVTTLTVALVIKLLDGKE